MRVSHFLSVAVCAGTLVLAGGAVSEEEGADTGKAASAENGEKLFTEKCSVCHTGAVAPKPGVLGKHDREAFQEKVDGHAKVGAFEGLTEENLNDIHAYLQTQAEE